MNKNYVLAREDYYFVYPTRFHEFERQFRGSFQHGGVSLEEMVLPHRDAAAQGSSRVSLAAAESDRRRWRARSGSGAAFAPSLRVGDVLALSGPLGAGKTRFVAGPRALAVRPARACAAHRSRS